MERYGAQRCDRTGAARLCLGLALLLGMCCQPVLALTQQPPPVTPPESQALKFIGCYKDTSVFDLNGHLERSAQNTPQRCVALCRGQGFAYAGVQYGESCLCGNSYGRYGPADNCNYACTGDAAQTCGGYNANSIYSVPGNAAPPLGQPVPLCWPATINSRGQCSDGGPPRR